MNTLSTMNYSSVGTMTVFSRSSIEFNWIDHWLKEYIPEEQDSFKLH